MRQAKDIGDSPWNMHDWKGQYVSIDGAAAGPVALDDVQLVIAYGDTGQDWDGESAAVVLLKDGRFCSWESDWGPTGSGFCCDAYGGTADVWFSSSLKAATSLMSERALELIRDQLAEVTR